LPTASFTTPLACSTDPLMRSLSMVAKPLFLGPRAARCCLSGVSAVTANLWRYQSAG
jgi:hypothetical protein